MEKVLFNDWFGLLRTLVAGALAYFVLVAMLRISGNRTLSKLNAFDLVVTVALGSTLATILLNKNVAVAEGALAFALLIGLQYAVTWSSVRVSWVRRAVTGEPCLLLYQGTLLPRAQRHARVTDEEIRSVVRRAGLSELQDAEAVVLETDGSLSVVRASSEAEATILHDVKRPSENVS